MLRAKLRYSGVSEPGCCQGARVGLLGQVRSNILTIGSFNKSRLGVLAGATGGWLPHRISIARVLNSIPLLSIKSIWIVVVVLRVLVSGGRLYSVLWVCSAREGACFRARLGQIVTCRTAI